MSSISISISIPAYPPSTTGNGTSVQPRVDVQSRLLGFASAGMVFFTDILLFLISRNENLLSDSYAYAIVAVLSRLLLVAPGAK